MQNLAISNNLNICLKALFSNIFASKNKTDVFWLNLLGKTVNSTLLTNNIFSTCISKKNANIFLVSAVEERETELKEKKEILGGIGCLGNVIYCVQAYPHENNLFKLHNFGTVVMRHRDALDMTPLLFNIHTSSKKIGRMNYLKVGKLVNFIRKNSDILNNDELKKQYNNFKLKTIELSKKYIDQMLDRYTLSKPTEDDASAKLVIETISNLGKEFNFLSYVYFEAVSLALMLCSNDKNTLYLKERGEFNHLPYIDMVHKYKSNKTNKKFESYGFVPNVDELKKILRDLQNEEIININFDEIFITISNNIIFYIGTSMDNQESIEGMLFHDFCHLGEFRKICKPKLDEYSSYFKNRYMELKKFDLVINSVIEKGEIGICPSINLRQVTIFSSKYSEDLKTILPKNEILLSLKMIEKYTI